jgi:hypothetical protein
VRGERLGVADPGQHQVLRRVDHAAGENHLALGAGDPTPRRPSDIRPQQRDGHRMTMRIASA